ncbi:peptidoglycan DD-metalloendopeptidase family protein [Pseudomonas mangrovi]|uniref:Peptidase M23 n=1 Tax=Pseudomonas mangrovi TaxID=2161748 RepID=A0A2T5PB29_9PSED|nr:peptidoglycan DD-metalloendopeptidase family protein [Pseudomonas mangrovi]PTU74917.1 peptidase M23 [Pseudomonas mangrovi]
MTDTQAKARPYPRSHILAASGVAALLSLSLLVFPSREVEAKKSHLSLDLTQQIETAVDRQEPQLNVAAEGPSPFAVAAQLGAVSEAVPKPKLKVVTVANGDTLSTIFNSAGLSASTLHEVLNSSKDAKQLTRLKVGQEIEFLFDDKEQLSSIQTRLGPLETLSVTRGDKGFVFAKEVIKPDVRATYARGVISSSLFLAAKRAGLSHSLTMDLANVFGYDIDFALDIRDGDEFELVYEEKVIDGRTVGTGNILAARFTNRGKTFTAVRYTNKQGVSSFYNADGTSMRKAFIRTPVDFARISSRFSTGRKHPILNKIRAHNGVDYAAPHGTPIKAAGDGRVILAGRKGGYGNTVIIQHGQSYRTLYAHMQGFAKGVRNGSTVEQGQIIGYIGTTGLSTGPHLHYEFQVNGVHVDPLSQKLPMADPIAANEKQRFLQLSQPLVARLDDERATALAMNH